MENIQMPATGSLRLKDVGGLSTIHHYSVTTIIIYVSNSGSHELPFLGSTILGAHNFYHNNPLTVKEQGAYSSDRRTKTRHTSDCS
jgi:hypothetical protein